MSVVRAQQKTAHIAVRNKFCVAEVLRRRAVTDMHIHSLGNFFVYFLFGYTLMVCGYARAKVAVQIIAVNGGRVPVYNFICRVRRLCLFKRVGVAIDYTGVVHKLAQTEYIIVFDIFFYILAREHCSARFEGRCGHAGGQLNFNVQRHVFCSRCNIFAPCHSADVCNFVRVCDYGGCAAGYYQGCELLGGKLRAFDMNVSVDIPRQNG